MWSEHCSYKSSRIHLKKLPTRGPRVLQGPGENAGAVDIGDGLAAVFKIESHNHPSFIEPYQGAATGVGGIIRDIFTMGARPIALLNSLRFGSLDGPTGARTRRIMEGVVAGIAGYGNSIGIPTVGGEIAFEDCYAGNPLVNVMCLGIVEADALVKGRASGVGNPVYYVGAKTGRDGIHGATMASAEFDERSAEKRPAVQVGDPFMEKLLLEACLELMATDALVGVQDMGAAGLTCSTCEMGARGGAGVEIDVRHVPQRETGMTPYEIMLSESQERMLLAVKRGREAEVERIFDKWDLHASRIGVVTDDGLMRVKDHGEVVAEIPNSALVDDAPVYDRPTARPAYLDEVALLDLSAHEAVVAARGAARAPHRPDHRQQALGLPAIRPHGPDQHAGARGHGCRRRPNQGHAAGAGDVDRRQWTLLLPRPAQGRHARRGGGRPQCRLCGRTADWRDELPQLRQPGEAGNHVADRPGRRRHCRGLPRARRADHRRQRQPLQRDRRHRHLSDPHHRRGRRHRRCGGDARPRVPRRGTRRRAARRIRRPAGRKRIPEGRARHRRRAGPGARPGA